ncbi:YjhX family toxin [Tropicimonas sp. S265A]|uniref:YjhX family toxin n=1 Tax=Tropicimonas sp. S265A TaxID=3415134 RepID=UPI003C7C34C1
MNISKQEQRVLHVLAQGGAIHFERGSNGKVRAVSCLTRDGYRLTDCTLTVFERLRRRRLIRSSGGHPYRITRDGLHAVRAQLDNR